MERLDEDTEKLKQIKSAYICTFCLFVYYQKLYILKIVYIQLPFDVKYNSKNKINLNFPSNYKSEVLFSQLPFLAHPGQPVFEGKLDKFLNDQKGIQKFFLVMGDPNDSI